MALWLTLFDKYRYNAAAKTGKRIMDAKNDDKDIAYRPTTLA